MSAPPWSPQPSEPDEAPASGVRRYLGVVAVFAVLSLAMALGITGWSPSTGMDWIIVLGLVPGGVGGALLGDRVGLWLKDRGLGRQ